MRVYLAETYSRDYVVKLYLAGEHPVKNGTLAKHINHGPYILESYYYARNNKWLMELVPRFRGFMLDSGAFTFMSQESSGVDFEKYTEEYANFIRKFDIDFFFELDIDSVVPWERYLDLRKMLADRTGKEPIPVFHKSRGKEWFERAVQKHDYIAIGGLVTGEIRRNEYYKLQWFIDEAHRNNCKIHGLGFTNLNWLKKLRWDSVDSSSWLYGNRSGVIYKFNGSTITKHKGPDGMRLRSREAAIHNFCEWVKFSEYMDRAYA